MKDTRKNTQGNDTQESAQRIGVWWCGVQGYGVLRCGVPAHA